RPADAALSVVADAGPLLPPRGDRQRPAPGPPAGVRGRARGDRPGRLGAAGPRPRLAVRGAGRPVAGPGRPPRLARRPGAEPPPGGRRAGRAPAAARGGAAPAAVLGPGGRLAGR